MGCATIDFYLRRLIGDICEDAAFGRERWRVTFSWSDARRIPRLRVGDFDLGSNLPAVCQHAPSFEMSAPRAAERSLLTREQCYAVYLFKGAVPASEKMPENVPLVCFDAFPQSIRSV